MTKLAEDLHRDESEQTPEPSHLDADNIPDGPSLPDQTTEAENMDVDPSAHADDPPSPTKVADNDVVVTGIGFTSPGNPIAFIKAQCQGRTFCYGQGQVENRFIKLCPPQRPRHSFWIFKSHVHKPRL